MAKKATLLKRAQKLNLDVTEKSTVPEITAALEAHEKATTKTPAEVNTDRPEETTPSEAPQAPESEETGAVASIELGSPESSLPSFKDVLLVFNSINKSRRRWIQNRNLMRNNWKELFEILERASGRDGKKATMFDENWHVIAEKGIVTGPVDREADDVQIAIGEPRNEINPEYVEGLEAEVKDLKAQLQAALEAKEIAENGTTGGKGDDEAKTAEKAGKASETSETPTE